MLATFILSNFKSFREAQLPLGPLTVLIGANAAGKSNAIEALRLLSWLAQGQKLSSIQYAVNSADRVGRGRIDDLCHRGQSEFGLGCITDDLHWNQLSMQISLREGELHISAERDRRAFGNRPPLRHGPTIEGAEHRCQRRIQQLFARTKQATRHRQRSDGRICAAGECRALRGRPQESPGNDP